VTAMALSLRNMAPRFAAAIGILVALALPASAATEIERIVSPGGIEAWLVRDTTLPLIAIDFAFRGGSNQDPADRAGLANLMVDLLDEGAGNLDARAYHERIENNAIGLSFSASRDYIAGSLHTLVDHRDQAFELLKLALTAPRFDT
jgi:zinc protease